MLPLSNAEKALIKTDTIGVYEKIRVAETFEEIDYMAVKSSIDPRYTGQIVTRGNRMFRMYAKMNGQPYMDWTFAMSRVVPHTEDIFVRILDERIGG